MSAALTVAADEAGGPDNRQAADTDTHIVMTGMQLGIVRCHACGMIVRLSPRNDGAPCPRCLAPLHQRRPNSLARTWAFLIAAGLLYIPANLLPILRTEGLGSPAQEDTILSGVIDLWHRGSWDLALIVFVASILVPGTKIVTLVMLLISTRRGSAWNPRRRGLLYRIIDFIGHWSMLDVFVCALMAALVRFQTLAEVTPKPGAVAFGAVVVLTMLASKSFDPRLIWDASARHERTERPT